MNDEIKEIYLSNLEWTETHDNIGGVMGNVVFKNNMSYEEYSKLFKSGYFILCDKDYITNLQQENENLKEHLEAYKKDGDETQDRIDKALGMLHHIGLVKGRQLTQNEMSKLFSILQGDSNENN